MLILALDSCGSACAVGLWQDGQMLAQAQENMARGQDARLMPMIVDLVTKSGHEFSDLDKIAVTRGPGSFTGSRVGLAAARGIGLAAHKPVIGIDRFAIYHALNAAHDKNLLVVIESKRAELFCRFFPAKEAAHAPGLMTQRQIDDFIAAHPGTIVAGDQKTNDGDIIKTCAALASRAEAGDPAFSPLPLYLRDADVSFPKER